MRKLACTICVILCACACVPALSSCSSSYVSVFNDALSNTVSYRDSYTAWENEEISRYYRGSSRAYLEYSKENTMTINNDTQERAEVTYEAVTEEGELTEDVRYGLYYTVDGGFEIYYEYNDNLGTYPSGQFILNGSDLTESSDARYQKYRNIGDGFFADAPSSRSSKEAISRYLISFSSYADAIIYEDCSVKTYFTRDSYIRTYFIDYTYSTTETSDEGVSSAVTYSGTISMDISTDMLEDSNDPMISRIDANETKAVVSDNTEDYTASYTVHASTSTYFSYEYLESLMPTDFSNYVYLEGNGMVIV